MAFLFDDDIFTVVNINRGRGDTTDDIVVVNFCDNNNVTTVSSIMDKNYSHYFSHLPLSISSKLIKVSMNRIFLSSFSYNKNSNHLTQKCSASFAEDKLSKWENPHLAISALELNLVVQNNGLMISGY